MRKIEFYGQSSAHYYGEISAEGDIEVHSPEGNYWHGKLIDGHKIELFDHVGRFYHGQVELNGEISIYDDQSNYYYGTVGD